MNRHTTDPVCGMAADPGRIHASYRGIRYGFCSQQCRQRFLANPGLYVGEPGHLAPKQQGMEIIKTRHLRLAVPMSPIAAAIFEEALQRKVGVRGVVVQGNRVEIRYDLLETAAEDIEAEIAAIGATLGDGWSDRLTRALVHYEEECELDNLAANDKHCCEVPRR